MISPPLLAAGRPGLLDRPQTLTEPDSQGFYGHPAFRHRHGRRDQFAWRGQELVAVPLDEDDRSEGRHAFVAIHEWWFKARECINAAALSAISA